MFEKFLIDLLDALDEATSFQFILDGKSYSFHPGIFWIILLLLVLIAHFSL